MGPWGVIIKFVLFPIVTLTLVYVAISGAPEVAILSAIIFFGAWNSWEHTYIEEKVDAIKKDIDKIKQHK